MANMFKPTKANTPKEYLDMIDEPRRSEMKTLHTMIMKTIPDLKPHIVSGMIGYGTYHYKSKSGREGDWSMVLLASQKNYISVYACGVDKGVYVADAYKSKLPKASIGKSCIRFKKLADVDLDILMEIVKKSSLLTFGV